MEEASPEVLHFEGHTLDVGARQCSTLDGADIPLTRAEFAMLLALARQNGRVVSRDELRQAVVRRDAGPDDRSVDMLVSRLRRKIEPDPKQPKDHRHGAGRGIQAGRRGTDHKTGAFPPWCRRGRRRSPAARSLIEQSAPDAPQPLRNSPRAMDRIGRPRGRRWPSQVALWFSGPATRDAPLPAAAVAAAAQKFDASVVPLINDEGAERIGDLSVAAGLQGGRDFG